MTRRPRWAILVESADGRAEVLPGGPTKAVARDAASAALAARPAASEALVYPVEPLEGISEVMYRSGISAPIRGPRR